MKAITLMLLTLFLSLTDVIGQNEKDSLIVFVGEIIEVKEAPVPKMKTDTIIEGKDTSYVNHSSPDNRYEATYKILQLVHGTYTKDTIDFVAYDHYGKPAFSDYKNVLLFVSIYKGKRYHEKYLYNDLYLARNGKWASPYSSFDYNHAFKKDITVQPEKIEFKRKVSFPINKLSPEDINNWYPAPYYIIKKGEAIAVYGNYVDDLFILKQQTVLKAREIYKKKHSK